MSSQILRDPLRMIRRTWILIGLWVVFVPLFFNALAQVASAEKPQPPRAVAERLSLDETWPWPTRAARLKEDIVCYTETDPDTGEDVDWCEKTERWVLPAPKNGKRSRGSGRSGRGGSASAAR